MMTKDYHVLHSQKERAVRCAAVPLLPGAGGPARMPHQSAARLEGTEGQAGPCTDSRLPARHARR